jgi:hypothetical protein
MLDGMLRLALVVVGAVVADAAAVRAAPNGRVVRVERDRNLRAVPRLCDLDTTLGGGLCIGAPTPGDLVALIDHERGLAIGEFRIDTAAVAADPWTCTDLVYKVTGTLVAGDPIAIAEAPRVIGLRNLPIERRAVRVLKDQLAPHTHERAELALDTNNDGRTDYMLVRYVCDDTGHASASDHRICFDSYLARAGRLERAHQDIVALCY